MVALALCLAGACTSTHGSGDFSDGRGFGLIPAKVQPSASDMRSSTWDVQLLLTPESARVAESPDSWSAQSAANTSVASGQFQFMVMRNPEIDGASARKVVGLLRDDEISRGIDASEITDAEFMGLPGAMFVSFPDDGLYNVTLLTVSRKCVYVLSVTRSGDQQQVADWFGRLVTSFRTYSGGPANAPACQ